MPVGHQTVACDWTKRHLTSLHWQDVKALKQAGRYFIIGIG